jgi:hypothetical protein
MLKSRAALVAAIALTLLTGCGSRPARPVEDLSGTHDVSGFALTSLKGTRDGERLRVEASYGDDAQMLKVNLQFNVTPPARLESGTWTGAGGEGNVRERSVTFLGGQSGPPSIGGRFDLVANDGRPLYRVTIPLQPLKQPL